MKYSLFPGCSLERNAAAYLQSTLAISKPLDIELVEIEDWNCCGATEYISLNKTAAFALVARNLAQAAKLTDLPQMVAPCSACFINLIKADKYMAADKRLGNRVNAALAAGGLSYTPGTVHTRHLLDVVVNDVGYPTLLTHVTKPLKGIRVAPYYGCLIMRPGAAADWDDPEYPVSLDKLLRVLGAEVIDFPMKTHCCGGHMTQISEGTGLEMIRRLVKGAADYKADMIVTLCPMCQLNLDAFQPTMNRHFKTDYRMPILYFTQVMGVAFGMSAQSLGLGSEFISAAPALAKIGVEVPVAGDASKEKKPRKDDKSLPMPRMDGE
jgi:heterodisulfide reductase subunit B2